MGEAKAGEAAAAGRRGALPAQLQAVKARPVGSAEVRAGGGTRTPQRRPRNACCRFIATTRGLETAGGRVGGPRRALRAGTGAEAPPSHLRLAELGAAGRGRAGAPLPPPLEHRVLELAAQQPAPGLHRAPAERASRGSSA